MNLSLDVLCSLFRLGFGAGMVAFGFLAGMCAVTGFCVATGLLAVRCVGWIAGRQQ